MPGGIVAVCLDLKEAFFPHHFIENWRRFRADLILPNFYDDLLYWYSNERSTSFLNIVKVVFPEPSFAHMFTL